MVSLFFCLSGSKASKIVWLMQVIEGQIESNMKIRQIQEYGRELVIY